MKISRTIASKYKISKRLAKKYIKSGYVLLNSEIIQRDLELSGNEEASLLVSKNIEKYDIDKFLIAKYDTVVFLYKPPFMHTERHKLEDDLTLSDIIENNFSEYRLISRLDYETDGVVPAVKVSFKIDYIRKYYLAFVYGRLDNSLTLRNKIDAHKKRKVIVTEKVINNETAITPLKYFKDNTLVLVTVSEATRHQIRALLSYISHPIAGDKTYGIHDNFPRLMLRCQKVAINNFTASSKNLKSFIKLCKI